MDEKYPIKEDWLKYYKTLEAIRQSGITNMFGASPYLYEMFPDELTEEEARQVLCNWISNYDALNKRFGWQK